MSIFNGPKEYIAPPKPPKTPHGIGGKKLDRITTGIYAFLHPEEVNPPTPYTEKGLKQYDHLHPLEAVLRAWVEPGPRPDWHRAKKEQVRAASPLLARALDRAVDLMYQSNALTKEGR